MFCKLDSIRINSRNGTVSSKSHSKCLCQAIHRVCRIHTGTGTTGRTDFFFKLSQFLLCHSACCVGPNCLKHGGQASLLSFHMAGQHRSTGNKHGRNIDSCRCHQQTRNIFITVGNHYKSIKLMGKCHTFRGIGNQISCHKRIFHTDMSHSNTVTYCNCREHNRNASRLCNAKLDSIYNFIKVHMPGNNFIV